MNSKSIFWYKFDENIARILPFQGRLLEIYFW